MHDPMTVAFDIRCPWPGQQFGLTVLTIWHVDPEADGSDDSCGWSRPKLSKKQRSIIDHLAYCEAQTPWFLRDPVKRISSPADAEALLRGAIQMVSRSLGCKLRWPDICEMACDLAHNSNDNFQGSLCHLPGWHTNLKEDDVDERKRAAAVFFSLVARVVLRQRRRWWQHPRWHVWHWRIQVPVLQNFKRWVFSRCEHCGKGFRWGESPCTTSWNTSGPRWFASEEHIHHAGCSGGTEVAAKGEVEG